jgi:hypothetical protein
LLGCHQLAMPCLSDTVSCYALPPVQVVHSRTFGNAAKGGGVGVRMLCPLVDMFNHGGDETSGLLSSAAQPTDSVRWDVVGPSSTPNGEWEMVVTATKSVTPEEPLLLSYGERANGDFFLHYGWVVEGLGMLIHMADAQCFFCTSWCIHWKVKPTCF